MRKSILKRFPAFSFFFHRNKLVDGTEVIQEVHSKPKSPGGPPLPSGSASGSPSSQQSKVARLTQFHYIDIYSIT